MRNKILSFKIGKKTIGKAKAFIIAEIGINHNGDLSTCKKLVYEAKKSGADAVKLQIINPEESYIKSTKSYRIFKKNYLNFEEIKKIKKYANKLNIILFATPGDFSSLNIVKRLNFPAIKISSGLMNNIPLIRKSASMNIPIIISTGFAEFNEIKDSVKNIFRYHKKLAVLKCTSLYPAPLSSLNLNSIKKLKRNLGVVVGYSDHSLGELSCLIAVALGAKVIEKHFTLNKNQKGADHKISMTPKEFLLMVNKIRKIEESLGGENVFPTKKEYKIRRFFRRTIVSRRLIKKGEKIKFDDFNFQRTNEKGKRLNPKDYFKIIGKKTKRNILPNKIISKNLLK